MKIDRSKIKDWGGGSGITIFDSDFFDVVIWGMSNGKRRTEIRIKYWDNKEIYFEGTYNFKSDKACFEQLTIPELKGLIKAHRKQAFRAGRDNKI